MYRTLKGGVSKTQLQHVYSTESIITRQRTAVCVGTMNLYIATSSCIPEEVQDVVTTLKNQEQFQLESIRAVPSSAESHDCTLHIHLIGYEELEMTWETVQRICAITPQCLANQIKKMDCPRSSVRPEGPSTVSRSDCCILGVVLPAGGCLHFGRRGFFAIRETFRIVVSCFLQWLRVGLWV